LKILVIHNRYQQRGGEDTTFEQEVELLGQTEEVRTLIFQNHSGWRGAAQFFISIWNVFSAAKIKKSIFSFQPEVVHVHNWHYALGPLVIRTVHRLGIPIVLTVQNYRLLCPSATLLYRNTLFLDSIPAAFPWKAIRKKVYRDSFPQTLWLALIVWFHKKRGTWVMVDRYILQTELAKSVFISSALGLDQSRFVVKPNFIKDPEAPVRARDDFFLFIGRLSSEKGIDILLGAFKHSERDLYIGGDGPQKEGVLLACKENAHIHYLGLLDKDQVRDFMYRCSALIFPSIWYEGMPLTLIEAFAVGTPVIASNLGAMSTMVIDGYNGLHFIAGDLVDLKGKISFWGNQDASVKKRFSEQARACYEKFYTPDENRKQISDIYRSVTRTNPESKPLVPILPKV
jgi:glycosyltransferase involved in cell wall biosynthesis